MVAQSAINPFLYGKFRGDLRRGYKHLLMKLVGVASSQNAATKKVSLNITCQQHMTQTINASDFGNFDSLGIGGSHEDIAGCFDDEPVSV